MAPCELMRAKLWPENPKKVLAQPRTQEGKLPSAASTSRLQVQAPPLPWAGTAPSPAQIGPTVVLDICQALGKKVKHATSKPSSAVHWCVL